MQFIIRRILYTIPVVLGVTLVTFAIIKFTPGDPILLMLGQRATEERAAELREQLGLNDPVHVQYGNYVLNMLRGDLGTSIRTQTPVLDEIWLRVPSTIELTAAALLLATAFGIPAGIIMATHQRGWLKALLEAVSLIGLSVPNYWFGIVTLSIFAVDLGWISVLGGDGIRDLILPAIALGLPTTAVLMRLTKSTMLEALSSDYIRTAHAKGLPGRDVIWRHVLRNAMIPVVTAIGLQTGALLGGAVIIESVFARPGLGRYAVTAIINRDFPQIQGMIVFSAIVYVIVNLIVDMLYTVIDPRVRM